jgi:uncharacterized membrane-anchored protein YhcB (DUF1043 family)
MNCIDDKLKKYSVEDVNWDAISEKINTELEKYRCELNKKFAKSHATLAKIILNS